MSKERTAPVVGSVDPKVPLFDESTHWWDLSPAIYSWYTLKQAIRRRRDLSITLSLKKICCRDNAQRQEEYLR